MFDTNEELLTHITLGEDSPLELKALSFKSNKVSEPHRSSMSDELAAMANSNSGVFVLGVDDKTKTVLGIPEDKLDIVETWIRNICNDIISPPLLCRINKILLPGFDGGLKPVIRVDINKSIYVHKSSSGYFYRIGSSKREMSPELLARLFQQRSQTRIIRFDEQAVPQAPLDVLEKKLWSKFRTPLSSNDDTEFMTKMSMIAKDDSGNYCPTVSGLLIASLHSEEYITNSFIQAVCYRGKERNAEYQIDASDITGPIDVQIKDAFQFVYKNMKVSAKKDPHRIDIPQFSRQAVFEAIVNAVAHRDYSISASKIRLHMFADRLEISSPGAIPNTMTIGALSQRQATRNETLTSLLSRCPVSINNLDTKREFLMDRRGEGVPIIISESEVLSGRKPEFKLIDDTELQLIIFSADIEDDK